MATTRKKAMSKLTKPAGRVTKTASRKPAIAALVSTIVQEEIFDAAPMDVYEALVEPRLHAAFTGSPVTGDPVEGSAFTAWDGYIRGTHERLVPGARIVQAWRTTEFPAAHADSRLEIELRPVAGGKTRLRLTHTGVPQKQAKQYETGWVDHYWAPLRQYFKRS